MTLNLLRHSWRPNSRALHGPEKGSLSGSLAINEHFSDIQQGDSIQPVGSHRIPCSKNVDVDERSISRPPYGAHEETLDNLSSSISDDLMLLDIGRDATSTDQGRDYGMGSQTGRNVALESRHTDADIKINQLLELTDAALRTFICGEPVRTSAGIRSIAASPGPNLAEIAPALFSPGYLIVRHELPRSIPYPSNS